MPPKRKAAQAALDEEYEEPEAGRGEDAADGVGDEDDEYEYDEYDDDAEADGRGSAAAAASVYSDSAVRDFSGLKLVPDHAQRPLWVCPDRHVFLETFNPLYSVAHDLLIAIAEPVGRPRFVHEFVLTSDSLYAAVSVGLETDNILTTLTRLSKVVVPPNVIEHIRVCTSSYGKAKLLLQHGRVFVETATSSVLARLLSDPLIRECRVRRTTANAASSADPASAAAPPVASVTPAAAPSAAAPSDPASPPVDGAAAIEDDDDDALTEEMARTLTFEVQAARVEAIKRRCLELGYRLLEEYDHRNDATAPALPIERKATTVLRPYQSKCLAKIFSNGRARSGVIVLPCGAGKTLVGVSAVISLKKSTLVLCNSAISVDQWYGEFHRWADLPAGVVTRFTAETKETPHPEAGIVITTYSMLTMEGKRSRESNRVLALLTARDWGLLVLDEVHVAPAQMFRKVISTTRSHCKLGLTATLVREDNRIADLNFLIGPKLYEANWMELTRGGFIANVQCCEVWCSMTPEFFAEYIKAPLNLRMLLAAMNPNKFRTCQYLINYHEQRGDKIIVFSDSIFVLQSYAIKLAKPYIYGGTPELERKHVLNRFRNDPSLSTVFLSKVGDTSIDLPDANVLIEISAHYGSRRQEAQRLGRILRPKKGSEPDQYHAFFYSLVSRDTQEMYFSSKRQQFLVDQGYSFKVLTNMVAPTEPGLAFGARQQQLDLLAQILTTPDKRAMEVERDPADEPRPAGRGAKRIVGASGALSGAGGLYMEVSTQRRGAGGAGGGGAAPPPAPVPGAAFAPKPRMHPLLKKLLR